jgi:nucleoside triphosphatase
MEAKYPRGVEVITGAIILNDRDEALLCHSPKWNMPTFPGGHVEPGERLEDAVRRETMEEVGLAADVIAFLGHVEIFWSRPHFTRDAHMVSFLYALRAKPDSAVKIDGVEIVKAEWVSLDASKKLVAESWHSAIDMLRAKLR